MGFYNDVAFFRVINRFVAQFGIHGDPVVNRSWKDKTFEDDSPNQHNQRSYVSFARAGPDTSTTQVFINLTDNRYLDSMGFAPFGRVSEGLNVVDSLYSGYVGNSAPKQSRIISEGNGYLTAKFPKLDYVIHTQLLQ